MGWLAIYILYINIVLINSSLIIVFQPKYKRIGEIKAVVGDQLL